LGKAIEDGDVLLDFYLSAVLPDHISHISQRF
jgi:hypothetical protein